MNESLFQNSRTLYHIYKERRSHAQKRENTEHTGHTDGSLHLEFTHKKSKQTNKNKKSPWPSVESRDTCSDVHCASYMLRCSHSSDCITAPEHGIHPVWMWPHQLCSQPLMNCETWHVSSGGRLSGPGGGGVERDRLSLHFTVTGILEWEKNKSYRWVQNAHQRNIHALWFHSRSFTGRGLVSGVEILEWQMAVNYLYCTTGRKTPNRC